jgi:hypothetical protein
MDRPESPRRFLSDELKGLDAKRLQIECRLSAKIDAEVYRPKERTQEGSIDSVAPNIARVLRQVYVWHAFLGRNCEKKKTFAREKKVGGFSKRQGSANKG